MVVAATKRHHLAKRQNITDRALRYRANATPPPGPRRCCLCGNPKARAEVGHVNGHEEDTDPRNLFWTCRSCNVLAANTLRKAKLGRLTRQYNPRGGADSLGAWMNAIASIKGTGGTMAVPDAVAMIHATSPEQRSQFAFEIWGKRRTRGTDKRAKNPAKPHYLLFSATMYRGMGPSGPSGATTRVAHGTFVRVLKKQGKRVLVTGSWDNSPFYGWVDASDVGLAYMYKSVHGDTPGNRSNPARRANFLGFGGSSKVTFDSRLERDAYNRGYLGRKDFDVWLRGQGKLNLAGSLKRDLEHAFDRGASDRLAHDKAQVEMKLLKSEKRETKAPAIPAGKTAADQSETYRDHRITRTASGWDVLGEKNWGSLKDARAYVDLYELTGGKGSVRKNNPNKRQRKKAVKEMAGRHARAAKLLIPAKSKHAKRNSYTHPKGTAKVDIHSDAYKAGMAELRAAASRTGTVNLSPSTVMREDWGHAWPQFMAGWRAEQRRKVNPTKRNSYTHPKGTGEAELRQGKSKAQIFETGSGKHTAEIIPASGAREEHSFSGPGSFKAAMSWARLRLHEVANPGRRFKVYALGNRRKNPADPAARMYEKFHGTPSTEVREYIEELHRHSWLAGLGPLVSIDVKSVQGNKDLELIFPDPEDASVGDVVMLCATEDGTQLIPVGGDQEVPVKVLKDNFGMVEADFARDNVLIGTITQITYRTKKSFEKNGEEEIDFYHALGSEGSKGIYPVLIYHPRNPSLEIAGGRYYIGKAEASLGGVSAGIIG